MASVVRAAAVLSLALSSGCALLVSFSGFAGSGVADAASDAGPLEGAAADAASDAGPPEGGATQPIELVQERGSDFIIQPASQASEVFGMPNTAGDTLIVLGFWGMLGFSGTVTDSLGNTYFFTPAATNPGNNVALQIFYVPRALAGANTVTLTMSDGFDSYVGLAIFEYAGLDGLAGANVLEGSAEQAAPSSTSAATTPPLTTSYPHSLLFAGFADENGNGTPTPGDGWTALVANSNFYMLAEAMTVSATGKFAASASLPSTDDEWVGLAAAFKGAQ